MARQDADSTTAPPTKHLILCLILVAGVGFEPTTFWFEPNNVEVVDCDVALETLLEYQNVGQAWINAHYPNTDQSDYAGRVPWMRELSSNPDAITYFGDHIEEDLFRTGDGHLHETLDAALAQTDGEEYENQTRRLSS